MSVAGAGRERGLEVPFVLASCVRVTYLRPPFVGEPWTFDFRSMRALVRFLAANGPVAIVALEAVEVGQ